MQGLSTWIYITNCSPSSKTLQNMVISYYHFLHITNSVAGMFTHSLFDTNCLSKFLSNLASIILLAITIQNRNVRNELIFRCLYNVYIYVNSGFQVVNKGCCGTGNIEVTLLCNRYTPGTCDDPSKYIFWDSYHPTEKAYKTLIPLVLENQVYKFF